MQKKLIKSGISLLLVVVMVFAVPFTGTAAMTDKSQNEDYTQDLKVSEQLPKTLVNYIAITESKQELSDTQQVVVGIGNGTEDLKEGLLTYKNTYTGDIYQVKSNDKSDEALSFIINYDNKAEGVYQLLGLEYEINGDKTYITLSDIDINVTWGVGVDCNSNPDSVIPVETEGSVNADDVEGVAGVTFDVTTEDGETATASSVKQALEEVTGDLSVSDNGVINTKASATSVNSDAKMVSDTGLSVSSNDVKNTSAGNVVIVLDPGHGGSDSGATYNGLLEKDVNLSVAYYCKAQLEQYSGVSVYMTRYDDSYVGLEERTAIAQGYGATAFISIHMNAGGGTGVEVWYPNANYNSTASNIGYGISGCILNNIVALGMTKRGLKIRNSANGNTYPDGSIADYYSVIYNSKLRGFAGIIVEHGFIDGDYDKLSNETFLAQLGAADALGIAQYFGLSYGEDLSQYEGAFDVDWYRFFNEDLWQYDDQQAFTHWIEYGVWEHRPGSPVFEMMTYVDNNPDLGNAFGWEWREYAKHFNQHGMSEGRTSIEDFSVMSYKNRYRDLRNAFGNDLRLYYMHYVNNGFGEDRETTGYDNTLVGGGVTNYWVIDFKDVYDYDYYRAHHSDLSQVYGINDTALIQHFFENGMNEGRQASANFNVWQYASHNEDLRNAFGWNLAQYYYHYMQYGKAEGRIAV